MRSRRASWTLATRVAAMAVLTTAAAYAYSKNISGFWKTPAGWRVVVTHNPDSGDATFRTTLDTDETGSRALAFKGRVLDPPGGTWPGYFTFNGDARSFDVVVDGKVCRAQPSFSIIGALVGDVGGRRIHAKECSIHLLITCGEKFDDMRYPTFDCSGVWH